MGNQGSSSLPVLQADFNTRGVTEGIKSASTASVITMPRVEVDDDAASVDGVATNPDMHIVEDPDLALRQLEAPDAADIAKDILSSPRSEITCDAATEPGSGELESRMDP